MAGQGTETRMDISIFGIGYVGAVSAGCLSADGHRITAVDTSQFKVDAINQGQSPIVEPGLEELLRRGIAAGTLRATTDAGEAVRATDLSIICVGTPSLDNGNLDLSYVVRVCEDIGAQLRHKAGFHAVVIRSTMLPGSMADVVRPALERSSGKSAGIDFGLAIFPEFMREGTAIKDYYGAGAIIFGAADRRTEDLLRTLTKGLDGEVHVTDLATAEAIKYANNAWHATKIVFANEIGVFCQKFGIDSHEVMRILCADHRLNISPVYLRPGFAYGGSCLPKDLRALNYKAKSADLELPLLEALPRSNDLQIQRVVDLVRASGSRNIGLIGLSFKGGTDDLRESPAVELAERLFGKGYKLRIFDRNVDYARLTGSNLSFIQTHIPHLSDLLTGDLAAVTNQSDVLIVTHGDLGGALFPALRPEQLVIDLARVTGAAASGARYIGLCW
jgi:GDP-mannose 6-dehydrogenase